MTDRCEKCKQPITDDRPWGHPENDWCEECVEADVQAQIAHWRPLYEAEKAAGLLRSKEELDQELRDAGRGHLVRP